MDADETPAPNHPAKRPKRATDPLARLQLDPLGADMTAANDEGAARGAEDIAHPANAPPHEPGPDSTAPRSSVVPVDPLADGVVSWPPVPTTEAASPALPAGGLDAQPTLPMQREASSVDAAPVALPDLEGLPAATPPLDGSLPIPAAPPEQPAPATRARAEQLASLEEPVSRGDWARVHALAGNAAVAPGAHPTVVLLDAMAARELGQGSMADAASQQRAMRAVAQLMDVDADSAVALLVTKRLLRRLPNDRAQPPAKLSVAVLFAGLLLGASAGWLITKLLY